jgi:hypothetical protein
MIPNDVLEKYGSYYNFRKETGMSASSLFNWITWGYVPENSQYKLERLTNGELKAKWPPDDFNDKETYE